MTQLSLKTKPLGVKGVQVKKANATIRLFKNSVCRGTKNGRNSIIFKDLKHYHRLEKVGFTVQLCPFNALVLTLLSTDAGIENVRIVEGLQVYGLQSQTGAQEGYVVVTTNFQGSPLVFYSDLIPVPVDNRILVLIFIHSVVHSLSSNNWKFGNNSH